MDYTNLTVGRLLCRQRQVDRCGVAKEMGVSYTEQRMRRILLL